MMLNEFSSNQHLETFRSEEATGLEVQMNSNRYSTSEVELTPTAHLLTNINSSNSISNNISTSTNSTSSSSISDQQTERLHANSLLHQEQFEQHNYNSNQQHHLQEQDQHYINVEPSSNNNNNNNNSTSNSNSSNSNNNFSSINNSSASSPNNIALHAKSETQLTSTTRTMNVEATLNNNMIPTAHGTDHLIHYSLPTTKSLSDTSAANMALNFSHDLLHQSNNHNQTNMHQHSESIDSKSQQPNSFELDSGLMQSAAAGMNMWKSTMNLNHFKHPVIDHNFLPNSDLNSFSNWTHSNNLGNQPNSMTHHILESQHLIGYTQHQRSLPMTNQDLVEASIKSQTHVDQTSFMLNSINHQASTSQNSSSSHQTNQPHDNLNLRSHPLDHNMSYNLSMNDNQLYNSSRSETRSHPNTIKSSFLMSERTSVHMTAPQNQLSYQNIEHPSLQPTTSQHVASSSNSGTNSSSKNAGIFRCSTCHEVFPLRTVYQSHLKTHSRDKGSKAKFQCELCGHSFSQKTSLNRHMKSHTGERPFPCEICAKAFSEKERLKIHMRTHTGEKPFSCSICGKSFSQKSTVKRHQTVHTGEKKFRCDCGKGFANRGNLIAHIKTRGSNHFE